MQHANLLVQQSVRGHTTTPATSLTAPRSRANQGRGSSQVCMQLPRLKLLAALPSIAREGGAKNLPLPALLALAQTPLVLGSDQGVTA